MSRRSPSFELAQVLDHKRPATWKLAHFHISPQGEIFGVVALSKWKLRHLFGAPRPFHVFGRVPGPVPAWLVGEEVPAPVTKWTHYLGTALTMAEACQRLNEHERKRTHG